MGLNYFQDGLTLNMVAFSGCFILFTQPLFEHKRLKVELLKYKMKKNLRYLFILAVALLFIRCDDEVIETFVANVPIYMSYDEFRSSAKVKTPQDLENPGKIYFYENYLFVNEYLKGIHVIDNSNPSMPVNIAFISIPGNVDIAIKDDILYADSFVDLVSFDISDINNIQKVTRMQDIFPYILPPVNEDYRVDEVNYQKGIVVAWELKKITREVQKRNYLYFGAYEDVSYSGINTTGSSITGIGGSMARFAAIDDYLYAIDNYSINIIDIEDYENIGLLKKVEVAWNIETIFPYNDHLFIGSQNGMLIYDISEASNPVFVSDYWHITSCDPVVVHENYAYVTLRSGNLCGEVNDQLDVIDILFLTSPNLVKSYAMENPYGLGIDNNILFLCDGTAGLKIYDISDPLKISENKIAEFPDIQAYDVIPYNDILMLIGDDGLYQYDYSDLENIKLISSITSTN